MRKAVIFSLIMLVVGAIYVFAQVSFTGSVGSLPEATNVTAALSRIDSNNDVNPANHTWVLPGNATTLDFSPLVYDSTYFVYRCRYYYALDVGLADGAIGGKSIGQSGTGDFAGTGNSSVGDNIAVVAVRQIDNTTATEISRGPLSSGGSYTGADLSGGWLRLYYGIYGGAANGTPDEVVGASPITSSEDLTGGASGGIQITIS